MQLVFNMKTTEKFVEIYTGYIDKSIEACQKNPMLSAMIPTLMGAKGALRRVK